MAATNPNPFTKTLDALWTLFEADAQFTGRVAEGNRVKYNTTDDRNPLKDAIATADLPEVAIVFDGGNMNLFDTSSSSKIVCNFRLIVNTGDFRVNEFASVINWIVLCNLAKWKTTLAALTWKGEHFIKRVSVVDLTVGESNPERNRNIKGWVTIWQCQIDMHFTTSNLVFAE